MFEFAQPHLIALIFRCYGSIAFHLSERSMIRPFSEVTSGFAPTLPAPRDVPGFSGIEFDVWSEESFPESVHVYIAFSSYQMVQWPQAIFRYDITEDAKKTQRTSRVRIPFGKFEPSPDLQRIGFEEPFVNKYQCQVYRVSILIEESMGIGSGGRIGLDHLEFY